MKSVLAQTKAYIVILLAAMVVVVWTFALGSRPVSRDAAPVRVLIANGTTAGGIANILDARRLVRSKLVFLLTCRMTGSSQRFKPGVYEFKRNIGVPEIIRKLVNGESLESWVTVPEGYTIRQIADLLADKQLVNRDAFLRAALDDGRDYASYPFIAGPSLEGYLFPDTYLIARGTDPTGIIRKMLDAFERKVAYPCGADLEQTIRSRFHHGDEYQARGLQRILTMASMVEREAKVAKDRPLIAAVLWNRLGKNMRLEVDAAVSYVPGQSTDNKSKVYYRDLRSTSLYNTYKYPGLPPGPICNPGRAAIQAVLHPAAVDYLFYVARADGSHEFSRTFDEHKMKKSAIRDGGQ